jgi:hypothetical protein
METEEGKSECPTQEEIDEGLEIREERHRDKDFSTKSFCQQYFGRG